LYKQGILISIITSICRQFPSTINPQCPQKMISNEFTACLSVGCLWPGRQLHQAGRGATFSTPNYCAGAVLYSKSYSSTQSTPASFGPIYGPYILPVLLRELKPAPFQASKAILSVHWISF